MHNFYTIIIFFLVVNSSFSQTISGTVTDTKGHPLVLANVLIKDVSNPENIKEFVSVRNGKYNIHLENRYEKILVEINADGYFSQTKIIENSNTTKTYEFNFQLEEDKLTELQ